MSVEREIKFTLEAAQIETVLNAPRVRRAARSDLREETLVSTYYDTPRHTLRRAGAALRLRSLGKHREQTIKIPTTGPAGMQNCNEWTATVSGDEPDFTAFPEKVLRQLPHRRRLIRLAPQFRTRVVRRSLKLAHRGCHFEMAVDAGRLEICGGKGRTLPICEVEFELEKGSAAHLLQFLIDLNEDVSLLPLYPSKAARGYALTRRRPSQAGVKAEAIHLADGLSVGAAFEIVVGEALRQLLANLQPLLEGSPGGVHQCRVAIRRIRAALRAFKRALPYEGRKAFNGEFRWFQERLSLARDWHVFHAETLPRMAADDAADGSLGKRLRTLALRERRQATAEAIAAFRDRRYTRLLLRFQHWLLGLSETATPGLEKPLKPFAAHALGVAFADFLSDDRALRRMSEDERHALRKRGKKTRYAIEFFSSLWSPEASDPLINDLEAFQDALGKANDAVVARHLVAGVAPRRMDPMLLLFVQQWSRAQEEEVLADAQPVWRRLQKASPFWA